MKYIIATMLALALASPAQVPHKITDPSRGMENFPCTLTVEGC